MIKSPVLACTLALLVGSPLLAQTGIRDVEAEQRKAFLSRFSGLARDTAGMGTLLYAQRAERVDKTRSSLPPAHPAFFPPDSGTDESDVVLARMLIPGGGSRHYFVVQTDGPSADPAFYFIDEVTRKTTRPIPADVLVIPRTGPLAVFQRSDSHFAKRATWDFDHGKLRERVPRSYDIGLVTATTGALVVRSSLPSGAVAARLAKGDSLEVISTDGRQRGDEIAFRVRTRPAGVQGWVLVRSTQCPVAMIIGLCWAGD